MDKWLGRALGGLGAVSGMLLLGAGTAAAPVPAPPHRSAGTPVPAGLTVLPTPPSAGGPTDVVLPPLAAAGVDSRSGRQRLPHGR